MYSRTSTPRTRGKPLPSIRTFGKGCPIDGGVAIVTPQNSDCSADSQGIGGVMLHQEVTMARDYRRTHSCRNMKRRGGGGAEREREAAEREEVREEIDRG